MSLKLFLYLIIPLFVLSMLVAPASSISVSYTSGGGGHAAFSSMSYDLDDSTTLRADAVLDSGSIAQSTQASGSGQNAINQQVSGGASSVGNNILSNGAFSASTSATASTGGAGIQQQVMAAGDASVSLSGTNGAGSAGQEAGVMSGVISASQSVSTSGSTSAGSGVAASQITEISGLAGSVGSGTFSDDGAMAASGSFLGEGILKAELSSNTLENVKLSGNVATDGVTWMNDEDLQQVAEKGGGVAVHGLRAVPGGMGTFDMNAASLDAGVLADMGQVMTQAQGGSYSSYALTGYRLNTRDPKIQLYLKDDSNLQGRGLTGVQVQAAITNAANTWDDAVAQNIFADGSTVIIDPNKNTDNPYDGSNVLAWKYLSDAPSALAYSRTRYNYPIVDGYWTALESDVSFNTAFSWSTTGVDGTPRQSGDPIDVETVALHELGHTIGLGDLYTLPDGDARKSDFSQIMNSYNDVQRTLGNGDRAAAQVLYGVQWSTPPEWSGLGGILTSNPHIIQDAQGRTHVFVRGNDMALYDNIDGNWYGLGGYLTSDPYPVRDSLGRIHVFVRGSDNALYDKIFDTSSFNNYWIGLGGVLTSNPYAVLAPNGHLKIAVRGGDSALYLGDLNTRDRSFYWSGLGGILTSNPSLIYDSQGRLHALVRGTDYAVYDNFGIGWYSRGGYLTSDPISVRDPINQNYIHTFVRGNDAALYVNTLDTSAGSSSWRGLQGNILPESGSNSIYTSNPSPVVGPDGLIHVFTVGTDSTLNDNIGSWSPLTGVYSYNWYGLGGIITSDSSAMLGNNNNLLYVTCKGNNDVLNMTVSI